MTSTQVASFLVLLAMCVFLVAAISVGVPRLARLLLRYRLEIIRDYFMDAVLDDQRGGTVSEGSAEYRYRNALRWIQTIAGMHYVGGAFDPEHMRELANLAADALAGMDIKDYETAMTEGKARARETAAALGFELVGEEDLADAEETVCRDDDYYDEVRRAVGRGAPTVLLGTSTRSLRRSLKRLQEAQAGAAHSDDIRKSSAVRSRCISVSNWLKDVASMFAGQRVGLLATLILFLLVTGSVVGIIVTAVHP